MRKTIEQLKLMRETEDHIEFKKGEQGNVAELGLPKNLKRNARTAVEEA